MPKIKLRQILESDATQLARLANNKNIADNLRLLPYPYGIKDAEDFIAMCKDSDTRRAISLKGDFIGMIGLHPDVGEYSHIGELGYWIGEEFWGMGFGTQAVLKMCTHGFENLGLKRIFARAIDYNPSSMRVLIKCGFQEEGISRKAIFKNNKYWDEHRFAKLAPELLT